MSAVISAKEINSSRYALKPHLRVMGDGAERKRPNADAHERRVVTAGRRERPLGDARLVPSLHPASGELLNDVILVRAIRTRLLQDLRGRSGT